MNNVRWGIWVVLLAGIVVTSGCSMPWRFVSQEEYADFMRLEDMNSRQARHITSLTNEKQRLTDSVSALEAQLVAAKTIALSTDQALQDKTQLLAMHLKKIEDLKTEIADLRGKMPELGPDVEIVSWQGVWGIRIGSDILFDPGKAKLKKTGQKALAEIVNLGQVQSPDNHLRICGFTDSDKIKHSHWKSNFELSGARALEALEFMASKGVDRSRVHFMGFGPHFLIRDANGKEIKKKSRRVEIYFLDAELMKPATSGKAAPAAPEAVTPK